jgi:hypothetical protein
LLGDEVQRYGGQSENVVRLTCSGEAPDASADLLAPVVPGDLGKRILIQP